MKIKEILRRRDFSAIYKDIKYKEGKKMSVFFDEFNCKHCGCTESCNQEDVLKHFHKVQSGLVCGECYEEREYKRCVNCDAAHLPVDVSEATGEIVCIDCDMQTEIIKTLNSLSGVRQ